MQARVQDICEDDRLDSYVDEYCICDNMTSKTGRKPTGYPVLEPVPTGSGTGTRNFRTGPTGTGTGSKISGPGTTGTGTGS